MIHVYLGLPNSANSLGDKRVVVNLALVTETVVFPMKKARPFQSERAVISGGWVRFLGLRGCR